MSYPIKGIPLPAVPDPVHPIPTRQEITAWYANKDNAVQVSLFIQALRAFQAMDINDMLSYFQVAGIHGFPAQEWDNAPNGGNFYCNHNMATFPTWHRPYLLLFEQRLYEIMGQIVSNIQPDSEQKVWEIEASHWRLPYWDWSAPQAYINAVGVPQLFTQESVTIMMPGGLSNTGPNPLYKFTNPSGVPMGDPSMGNYQITSDGSLPWDQCIATSRYGIFTAAKDPQRKFVQGVQNWQSANVNIQAHNWYMDTPGSISDLVSRLLSADYLKSWSTFSSTAHQPTSASDPTEYLSLEYIHNNIHVFGGGGDMSRDGAGHLSDVPVAAFDPLFWLHHCNIDRLCAMWQTLNKDKWFDGSVDGDPLPGDPLLPFHSDTAATTYTSDMVRDWTQLGYQYDTLEKPPVVRAVAAAATAPVHLNLAMSLSRSINMGNTTRQAVMAAPTVTGKENDYIINVVYDRYALQGRAYTLHFFIGTPPTGGIDCFNAVASHVGSIYTFSSPLEINGRGTCANCLKQVKAGTLSRAQVPITAALLHHAADPNIPDFNTMKPDDVDTYLTQHLSWQAVDTTGQIIPITSLPKTKIYVMAGKGEHPVDGNQLSRYGGYTHMWGPTQHKACGAKPPAGAPGGAAYGATTQA